jgi:hypothetical protein
MQKGSNEAFLLLLAWLCFPLLARRTFGMTQSDKAEVIIPGNEGTAAEIGR